MLIQCEMVELRITNTKCSERTDRVADWCDVCRIKGIKNIEELL